MGILLRLNKFAPLYKPPANSVLWMPGLGDPKGVTLRDRSGYGNHGTIVGATWSSVNGLPVLSHDGTDDYITVTNPSFSALTSGAIEIWTSPGVGHDLITIGDKDTTLQNVMYFQINTGGTSELNMVKGGVTSYRLTWTGDLADKWQHYLLASDGSTITLKRNNVAVSLTAATGANNGDWFGDLTGADNFTIGAELRSNNPVNDFTGLTWGCCVSSSASYAGRYAETRRYLGV